MDSLPSRRVATNLPPFGGSWAARHETEDMAGPVRTEQKRIAHVKLEDLNQKYHDQTLRAGV